MIVPLTKLAVARRQLATAIELLFDEGDLISIFSLAANAWEIVDTLCTQNGVESVSNQTRERVSADRDLKRDYINSPYRNFFKHADRDPDQVVAPLQPSHVEGLMFLAVEDYIRLNSRSPVQLQVFQLWYLAKHPNKLDPSVASELRQSVIEAFPGLPLRARVEQLRMGQLTLSDAVRDPEVLSDARTEPAFE